MKLRDLQIFVDVVEAGGMTQAATKKGTSQSGLSRTIRDLENKMQAQLLHRTGRGVELTPAGQAFYQFAQNTLQDYLSTQKRVAALSTTPLQKLSVAVPLRFGRLLVPELYRRFSKAMPEVAFQANEESSDRLPLGEFDMAVTYATTGLDIDTPLALFEEQLYLVGIPALISSPEQPIAIRELAALPLMLPINPRYRRLLGQAFRKADTQMNITRELESTEAALAFAAEGEGVAILPYSNIYAEVARGEVAARPIVEPCIERKIFLQVGRHLDRRAARVAIKTVRESLHSVAGIARWSAMAP